MPRLVNSLSKIVRRSGRLGGGAAVGPRWSHGAELVAAGPGNEKERLALLESHREDVLAKLAENQENLEIIDHKIDVYRGSLAAGDADRLWAPVRTDTSQARAARRK
jgi:hypothetical protein